MGVIEPMVIGSALTSVALPLASSTAVWLWLIGALGAAVAGVLLAVPRQPRTTASASLVHATEAL